MKARLIGIVTVFLAVASLRAAPAGSGPTPPPASPWFSPAALAMSPDGQVLYIACATSAKVAIWNVPSQKISRTIAVPESPLGLALTPDGTTLFVTCAAPESMICVVDTAQGSIRARIPAGHTAMAPVLSPDGRTLYVCNRFNNEVAFIDLTARKTIRQVKVPREPVSAAVTPDGKFLLVSNHLQAGRADVDVVAASVSVIDLSLGQVTREIGLPSGSGLLRDLRISPDGAHAIVAHQLSRFHLPTTQIERGWVNTSAVSLIDVRARRLINTVLLDNIDAGAANPWGAAWSTDGRSFCVTHAGTHELSVVDFPALLAKLARLETPAAAGAPIDYTSASHTAADVPNDLSFLVGVRRRIKFGPADRGPRAVALAGTKAYVANYFSDSLTVVDLAAPQPPPLSVLLQPPPEMSVVRRGEYLFNDAAICFQGWQSCASCHSSDARVDGMNWDNLNDGIGNPKNGKSLVYAHQTPPSMWLGVREDAGVAVRAGIRNSLFTVLPESDAVAMDEYIQSLDPIPSPHLVKGELSPAAQRGKEIFLNKTVGCADCHGTIFFTNLRAHDVGTRGKYDKPTDVFDTPSLVELWRTGPFLHDGSAVSVREVITTRNPNNQHGHTSDLSAQQVDDLVEYLLSL